VDGNNGLGAVVGLYSMDLAIKKAKEVGIGMVVAKALIFHPFNMASIARRFVSLFPKRSQIARDRQTLNVALRNMSIKILDIGKIFRVSTITSVFSRLQTPPSCLSLTHTAS
jgi:hypothetical protein